MKTASVYLYEAQSEVHLIDGYHLVDVEVQQEKYDNCHSKPAIEFSWLQLHRRKLLKDC